MRALQPQRLEPCYCFMRMGQGCEGGFSPKFISLAVVDLAVPSLFATSEGDPAFSTKISEALITVFYITLTNCILTGLGTL